jgi:hypothetical protein
MPKIKISELDYSIQKQIPISIRTFKDEYDLNELPPSIKLIVKDYLNKEKDINYKQLYDFNPSLSKNGDAEPITDIYDLVCEYFKNYLNITVNEYPFDCNFGCKLKHYLHKLDTSVQETLITSEVEKIAAQLSEELSIPIDLVTIDLEKSNPLKSDVEYKYNIIILINKTKKASFQF